jgi:hypothetical protein
LCGSTLFVEYHRIQDLCYHLEDFVFMSLNS